MAYVAARGGETAIQDAEQLYHALNGPLDPALIAQIGRQLPYLLDRVIGEASLYAPELAALAIAQTGGDLYEAVLLLRAYRSTQPRIAYALPVDAAHSLLVRRVSAAFKDIPGGQVLGPTLDYSHRILRLDALEVPSPAAPDETPPGTLPPRREERQGHQGRTIEAEGPNPNVPRVAEWLRENGLLPAAPPQPEAAPDALPDVTRDPLNFPAPRAHRLQSLARADTGGVLALGYASMRGYGLAHPTVNEVRLSYADVRLRHPLSGEPFSLGRVRVSSAEVLSDNGADGLMLGACATLGWNEVKTIAGAMLDLEIEKGSPHAAHSEEFVVYHTEPVEASGFCIHYKLPHYVTFASQLDALNRARQAAQHGQPQVAAAPAAGEPHHEETKK